MPPIPMTLFSSAGLLSVPYRGPSLPIADTMIIPLDVISRTWDNKGIGRVRCGYMIQGLGCRMGILKPIFRIKSGAPTFNRQLISGDLWC